MNKDFWLARGSLLLAALGTLACEEEEPITTVEPHPTIMEVVPAAFVSAQQCVDAPGGVRTYVATLYDESTTVYEDDDPPPGTPKKVTELGFAMPSSEIVPCSSSVAFGWVTPNREYWARIQAFNRNDLVLLEKGVPVVLDATTLEPVEPTWQADCAPTRAEGGITKRFFDCPDLLAGGVTTPTVVEVGIEAALGRTTCGEGADQIASFVVRRAGVELGRAACGERVRVEDLTPEEFVEFDVQTFSAGSEEAALGGTCATTVVAGVTLQAHCNPFVKQGAIAFDVGDLLAATGASCDATLKSLLVSLDGGTKSLTFTKATCKGQATFTGLEPGPHELEVTAMVNADEPVVVTCPASVEPGLAATPACPAR